MTLWVTAVAIVTLWLPGLAAVHLFARRLTPEIKFMIAPGVTIVAYSLAGVAGWAMPAYFPWISWATVGGCTLLGLVVLAATGGLRLLRAVDRVLPASYMILVLFSTHLALLPIQIPKQFPPEFAYTYWVRKDLLPVRIQALHHNLPIDNLIPYHFAEFILRNVDFRTPREIGCGDSPAIAPGQEITARTPIMSLVGAHYMTLFGPSFPRDHRASVIADLENDDGYFPFFFVGACLNALCILPAYGIAERLAGRTAARLTVLLLACNYGMILHTSYIWPKGLAGYFGLLLACMAISGAQRFWTMGALMALSYYSHPCGVGLAAGCCLYYIAASASRRRALFNVLRAGAVAAVLLLPWYLWGVLWIKAPGNLISQNLDLHRAGGGLSLLLEFRFLNLLRSLVPHAFSNVFTVTGVTFFWNSFFTLPGMLGLVLVPFFGASLGKPGRALIAATMGLVPLLIVAVLIGSSHWGLAPFGPWLFIPAAMGMVCGVLAALPPWARIAGGLAGLMEQALIVWFAIYLPHHAPFPAGDLKAPLRLGALIAVQVAAAIMVIVVSWPRVQRLATRFAARAICAPKEQCSLARIEIWVGAGSLSNAESAEDPVQSSSV
jgi:hypothetical protein